MQDSIVVSHKCIIEEENIIFNIIIKDGYLPVEIISVVSIIVIIFLSSIMTMPGLFA